MNAATDVRMFIGSVPNEEPAKEVKPVNVYPSPTTVARVLETPGVEHVSTGVPPRKFRAPLPEAALFREIKNNSSPLQIWEGTVLEINREAGVMQVLLEAKFGRVPRHTGEIDLEWVDEQDKDLVRPGAVFYLTLFKRTKPSVENAQELRFRRRPSWSATQLKQIQGDADKLLSKMRPLPTAT